MGSLDDESSSACSGYDSDSDLVSLKISLLGDCQIGKTSFVVYMEFYCFILIFFLQLIIHLIN
jgi:hypothetical protein